MKVTKSLAAIAVALIAGLTWYLFASKQASIRIRAAAPEIAHPASSTSPDADPRHPVAPDHRTRVDRTTDAPIVLELEDPTDLVERYRSAWLMARTDFEQQFGMFRDKSTPRELVHLLRGVVGVSMTGWEDEILERADRRRRSALPTLERAPESEDAGGERARLEEEARLPETLRDTHLELLVSFQEPLHRLGLLMVAESHYAEGELGLQLVADHPSLLEWSGENGYRGLGLVGPPASRDFDYADEHALVDLFFERAAGFAAKIEEETSDRRFSGSVTSGEAPKTITEDDLFALVPTRFEQSHLVKLLPAWLLGETIWHRAGALTVIHRSMSDHDLSAEEACLLAISGEAAGRDLEGTSFSHNEETALRFYAVLRLALELEPVASDPVRTVALVCLRDPSALHKEALLDALDAGNALEHVDVASLLSETETHEIGLAAAERYYDEEDPARSPALIQREVEQLAGDSRPEVALRALRALESFGLLHEMRGDALRANLERTLLAAPNWERQLEVLEFVDDLEDHPAARAFLERLAAGDVDGANRPCVRLAEHFLEDS